MTETTPHALDFASVAVTDLERSEEFYTTVLGFDVDDEKGPPHARVFTHERGAIFAIRATTETTATVSEPYGRGASFWFDVTDVQAVATSIAASAATTVDSLSPGAFGPEFTVEDPDGYRLTFHEMPTEKEDRG